MVIRVHVICVMEPQLFIYYRGRIRLSDMLTIDVLMVIYLCYSFHNYYYYYYYYYHHHLYAFDNSLSYF